MVVIAKTIFEVVTWLCMFVNLIGGENGQNGSESINASEAIAKFIGKVLIPLISNAEKPIIAARASHSKKRDDILHLIDVKVDTLSLYLQDFDKTNDETTIIEFYPRRSNNKGVVDYATFVNIDEYKKIRDVIKINLDNELVSDKTKTIVIKTIDALINQLNKSKCTQTYADDSVITLRNSDYKNLTITMKDWKNITNLFFNNLQNKMENRPEKLMSKADEINDFFINIMNNTIHSNTKQRMRCELVEVPRTVDDEKDNCANFKICSVELKKYLSDFYKDVTETIDSTFKNYAAMFIRDANVDDDLEKKLVEKVVLKTADANKERIDKVFVKHIDKFTLDERKNKTSNMALIDNYVKGVTKHIKMYIKKHIETDLEKLRARTLLAVKDDIISNLNQDLTQLENKYTDEKCTHFNVCNGVDSNLPLAVERRSQNDNNGVYVNLKLTMDDEFRNTILKPQVLFQKYSFRRNNINKIKDYTYHGVHKVTRTTFPDIKIKNVTLKQGENGNILIVETSR